MTAVTPESAVADPGYQQTLSRSAFSQWIMMDFRFVVQKMLGGEPETNCVNTGRNGSTHLTCCSPSTLKFPQSQNLIVLQVTWPTCWWVLSICVLAACNIKINSCGGGAADVELFLVWLNAAWTSALFPQQANWLPVIFHTLLAFLQTPYFDVCCCSAVQ